MNTSIRIGAAAAPDHSTCRANLGPDLLENKVNSLHWPDREINSDDDGDDTSSNLCFNDEFSMMPEPEEEEGYDYQDTFDDGNNNKTAEGKENDIDDTRLKLSIDHSISFSAADTRDVTTRTSNAATTQHPSSSVPEATSHRPRTSRRHQDSRRPKGIPKRPLSAYNLFFKSERRLIYQEVGIGGKRIGFEELGKLIGKRWQSLPAEERKKFVKQSQLEVVRYRKEMDIFDLQQQQEKSEAAANKIAAKQCQDSSKLETVVKDSDHSKSCSSVSSRNNKNDTSNESSGTGNKTRKVCHPSTASRLTNTSPNVSSTSKPSKHSERKKSKNVVRPREVLYAPTAFVHDVEKALPASACMVKDDETSKRPSSDQKFLVTDENGIPRLCKVEYICYKMKRKDANTFLDELHYYHNEHTKHRRIQEFGIHPLSPPRNHRHLAEGPPPPQLTPVAPAESISPITYVPTNSGFMLAPRDEWHSRYYPHRDHRKHEGDHGNIVRNDDKISWSTVPSQQERF